jgi:hypothetical protein
MPVMKLFVPVSLIFCCIRNWFATVAWTVGMPGMELNFLLHQELVCDGRVDCKNARDEVDCLLLAPETQGLVNFRPALSSSSGM